MKAQLRGIFLTSEDPARTAAFYRDIAGLDLEQMGNDGGYTYWRVDEHGVQIAIHDAKSFSDYTHPAFAESNVTHLYFKIEDLKDVLRRLSEMAVSPHSVDDVVVTVVDPDGRKVMFGTA
jgi:predicted enzyme related to lactoylglutathione lyase